MFCSIQFHCLEKLINRIFRSLFLNSVSNELLRSNWDSRVTNFRRSYFHSNISARNQLTFTIKSRPVYWTMADIAVVFWDTQSIMKTWVWMTSVFIWWTKKDCFKLSYDCTAMTRKASTPHPNSITSLRDPTEALFIWQKVVLANRDSPPTRDNFTERLYGVK